jgi:CBS domain-containing protein
MRSIEAMDLPALQAEAEGIAHEVGLLHGAGMPIGRIGRRVQALNAQLFARCWQLVAPPDVVDASCLFVMGSEGRGEQLVKTDQDNALVVRDDATFDDAVVSDACRQFSDALREFGYPDCPGGIMVSNPAWRRRASDFARTVRSWLLRPDPEGLMALAIFVDAHPVAGDPSLLEALRGEIDALVAQDAALLGRFAAAIDSFPEATGGWWNRLLPGSGTDRHAVDLKKAAIFPIVHGVRSLALRDHVHATGTADRLDALVDAGHLTRAFATELLDSLHFLMTLKLEAALAEQPAVGAASGRVHTDRLGSRERERLNHALALVKRFKALVRHQFHLDGG